MEGILTCDFCGAHAKLTWTGDAARLVEKGWKLNLDNTRGVCCPTCAQIENVTAQVGPEQMRQIRMTIRRGAQGLVQADVAEARRAWNALFDALVEQDRKHLHDLRMEVTR